MTSAGKQDQHQHCPLNLTVEHRPGGCQRPHLTPHRQKIRQKVRSHLVTRAGIDCFAEPDVSLVTAVGSGRGVDLFAEPGGGLAPAGRAVDERACRVEAVQQAGHGAPLTEGDIGEVHHRRQKEALGSSPLYGSPAIEYRYQ